MSSDQPQTPPTTTGAAPAVPLTAPSSAPAPAAAAAPRRRRPLVIGGVAAGVVLVLGLTFGGGVATGWAVSSSQGPAGFTPGEMPGGGPQMGQGGVRPDQGTLPTRPDDQSDDSGSTDDDS
ncbi:hypothetical protein AB0N73_10095 [Microbacterium sp. NPDC089189]|uniref:hypothetical protein n=1 Tax=Microbacterium sp. NPDC089189 TaxID=3154972 RepID=UPI0034296EFD